MAKNLKSKKEYTQKEIKKYGLCKHHLVGYKQLKALVSKQQKYIVNQDKVLDRLSKDIENKSNMMNLWMTNRQTWTDKINKDLLTRAENHEKTLAEIKAYYEGELKEQKDLYNECIDANKELSKVNRHCIKVNKDIIKDHHEITRAYKGLHDMGKFAEEEGIDVKRHYKMLPEDKDQFYDFKQCHKLLENGKVQHTWSVKKKKKKEEVN